MKETLLLTKHMREYPEDSHLIETYEKNNGYRALKKVLKEDNPEDVINEIKNFLHYIIRSCAFTYYYKVWFI